MPDPAPMADFHWKVTEAFSAGIAREVFWPMVFWTFAYVIVFAVVACFVLRRLGVIGRKGFDNYSYETCQP